MGSKQEAGAGSGSESIYHSRFTIHRFSSLKYLPHARSFWAGDTLIVDAEPDTGNTLNLYRTARCTHRRNLIGTLITIGLSGLIARR